MEEIQADLTIIGAGPAGLYGAYYTGFRGLSVAIIDSLAEPGARSPPCTPRS